MLLLAPALLLCPFLPQDLSPLKPLPAAATEDWLVERPARAAGVFRTGGQDEIALDNGLVRRTFRLAPNGATVALDDLMTKRSLLRGVKPEAYVEIDGIRFAVGGLVGQPNYAYLTPAWIDELESDPEALQLVDYAVGEPVERMAWKRVRHHAPDVAWPPKGVSLRLDYRLTEASLDPLVRTPGGADVGRPVLIDDDFAELADAWRVHASTAHERSSFVNEGKVGEIYTPANTSVFVERALPPGTRVVEAVIDAGTDRAASWGPGIALVWEARTIKWNLRPQAGGYDQVARLGLFDGQRENPTAGGRIELDLSVPWHLRLRVEGSEVHCDAKPRGGTWRTYETLALPEDPGDPELVRVGKLDRSGGTSDHGDPGEMGRSRVLRFVARGARTEEELAALQRRIDELRRITVSVHYELYDGVPCFSKWITVTNPTDRPVTVDRFTSEVLAVVEHGSAVESRGVTFPTPNLHVETDYAFGGMLHANANRHAVHWEIDPDYSTQVNYLRQTKCLLEVRPAIGPAQTVEPGGTFESFRAFVLVHDSTDRERMGLGVRRMYRTIAPWVTENPLMMHVRYSDWDTVKNAIDQCADVGFEMVILTFGSGFNIEDDSPEYLAEMKRYADYARSKGIEIGGYSLLSSRHVQPDGDNCVHPVTGETRGTTHGSCPALASGWGQAYFAKLYRFYEATGFRLLEHDGSYPGDLDAAARPPLQKGVEDSRWVQWRIIQDYYRWCRGQGIYLNVPDYYYLSGSNKCGMGYREVNWSLPRAQQVIHTRQNIHDGTWTKTPSMGWMFVPLTQYHGGGAAAVIEPLVEHLDHYERMLTSNLALGVQACYRGPRLYDAPATRKLVKDKVAWFKEYRTILESDVVHGRRADGRDVDWMLHVDPTGKRKGMLVVFNPLPEEVTRRLTVDLYYTGLTDVARVHQGEGPPLEVPLSRDYALDIDVTVPGEGMNWFVFE